MMGCVLFYFGFKNTVGIDVSGAVGGDVVGRGWCGMLFEALGARSG